MPILQTVPFWIHILIEAPASINFFFNPSEQLPSPASQAHAIIRQYAVLLLVSNLIALIFALRPLDQTGKNVAAALSVYHLAPVVRAGTRIFYSFYGDSYGQGLGGPWLHLSVHGGCFVALSTLGLWGKIEKKRIKD